jgi:hypothetical protein
MRRVVITHAKYCPVSKSGFVPDLIPGGKSACVCKFGARLAAYVNKRRK